MKKVQINTFGCKVNQYESAAFYSRFTELGHEVVTSGDECDIIIINTCSVTGKAGAQSRQAVRQALRNYPDARIIVTGCYSQLAGKELLELEELAGKTVNIIGNGDKHLLVDAALAEKFAPLTLPESVERQQSISPLPVTNFGKRTRAYLRIQDGCNAFCSYCIVPLTRGRSRSLDIDLVLKQAAAIADTGYREIVVTGIHVGDYGNDLEEDIDIAGIMAKLCQATPQVRYRLSSIEPVEINDKILDTLAANSNFLPHLHIPLQSGSDDILLRMNRRYTTSQFVKIVEKCHGVAADLAVGIDVMAGFPGESDEQFATTYSLLKDLDFTYLHVFPYSQRPGTPAAGFEDQVNGNIKEQRVDKLRRLSDIKKTIFYRRFIGDVRPVLVENKLSESGQLKGFTDNYIPVSFAGDPSLKNTVVQVKLESANGTFIQGKLNKEKS